MLMVISRRPAPAFTACKNSFAEFISSTHSSARRTTARFLQTHFKYGRGHLNPIPRSICAKRARFDSPASFVCSTFASTSSVGCTSLVDETAPMRSKTDRTSPETAHSLRDGEKRRSFTHRVVQVEPRRHDRAPQIHDRQGGQVAGIRV